MEVVSQAPQPVIKCYHSIKDGKAVKDLYQEFSPTSSHLAGQNLVSYDFEKSIDNFGGSFSFTVKEEVTTNDLETTFMDKVQPFDIIEIYENGSSKKVDFIGVVTTVSFGGISSNLNKTVSISGKSIEWLFSFYNINCDIKACIDQNTAANKTFLTDLGEKQATEGLSIKDIVKATFKTFKERVEVNQSVSNFIIGDIIDNWYGSDFCVASNDKFIFPITSNLFENSRINVIDYIRKLLPPPLYEIFGLIDSSNKPKICVRLVPYANPEEKYEIKSTLLTDFTLTKSCDELYTAFLPYVEGSEQSADFFMNLQAAESNEEKGYDAVLVNTDKVKLYGYQLLTCSFVGYTYSGNNSIDKSKLKTLAKQMDFLFSRLEEMYSGDFTIVHLADESVANDGEWLKFAKGLFYVTTAKHSWRYGDNPIINYQVIRGGEYFGTVKVDGFGIAKLFQPLKKLSYIYREFD